MPQYEYLCSPCGKKFTAILTIAEHDQGKVKCPKCGSTKVEQQWAAFFATTSMTCRFSVARAGGFAGRATLLLVREKVAATISENGNKDRMVSPPRR